MPSQRHPPVFIGVCDTAMPSKIMSNALGIKEQDPHCCQLCPDESGFGGAGKVDDNLFTSISMIGRKL